MVGLAHVDYCCLQVVCEVRLQDPSCKVGAVAGESGTARVWGGRVWGTANVNSMLSLGIKSVQMELNKQTIQTMVDGLVNIKQQLGSV